MEVAILLVSYDCGYYRKRMGRGPEKIFEAGLKPLFAEMGVAFTAEEIVLESEYPTEISAAFLLARKVADRVRTCRAAGQFPLVLSGNCKRRPGYGERLRNRQHRNYLVRCARRSDHAGDHEIRLPRWDANQHDSGPRLANLGKNRSGIFSRARSTNLAARCQGGRALRSPAFGGTRSQPALEAS